MLKKWWKRSVAFLASLWPALRLFLKWPVVAVGIAAIPVQKFIQEKFNLTPVLSRIISFAIFGLLLWISWHVAEVIVALVAIAFVMEMILLRDKIRARLAAGGELSSSSSSASSVRRS